MSVGGKQRVDTRMRDGDAVQVRYVDVLRLWPPERSLILDDAGGNPDDLLCAQHPAILVFDQGLARRPVRVRRVSVRLVVICHRGLSTAETVRPQVALYHDRFDGDHRPVAVVRHASAFVNHAHGGKRPLPRIKRGDSDDGRDGTVEELFEAAVGAVDLFVPPIVEVPVVDP